MSEVSHGVESVQVAQPQQEGIVVSKPVARVMMLVNAIVWGTGYTMLKHAQDNMPTQWLMFFRMGAATLLMAMVFFPHGCAESVCAVTSCPDWCLP